MVEISKKDWKVFREKLAVWQENYMERLCKDNLEKESYYQKTGCKNYYDYCQRQTCTVFCN